MGQIVEYERVQIIREILLAYGPTFSSAIHRLTEEAVGLQERIVDNEKAIVDMETERLETSKVRAERIHLLGDILARQAQLRALANVDVRQPFIDLETAHTELVNAARNPTISFKDAQKAIYEFYQKAKALHEALHPAGGET